MLHCTLHPGSCLITGLNRVEPVIMGGSSVAFCCCDKHHGQNQPEEEGLQVTGHHWKKLGLKFKKEPGGRNSSGIHGGALLTGWLALAASGWLWLAPAGSCWLRLAPAGSGWLRSLVIQSRPGYLGVASLTLCCILPHQRAIKKMSHRHGHKPM